MLKTESRVVDAARTKNTLASEAQSPTAENNLHTMRRVSYIQWKREDVLLLSVPGVGSAPREDPSKGGKQKKRFQRA